MKNFYVMHKKIGKKMLDTQKQWAYIGHVSCMYMEEQEPAGRLPDRKKRRLPDPSNKGGRND